jgi:hypothetical protein
VIEHPENRKFVITGEELWQLAIWDEMQGGNKSFVSKKNKLYDEIVSRYSK